MNTISKMGTTHFNAPPKGPDAVKEGTDPTSLKNQKAQLGPTFPPSPNTAILGGKNAQDSVAASMPGFTEAKLKRQSLEAMVAVLRSLVVWGTGAGSGGIGAPSGRNSAVVSTSDTAPPSARMSVDDGRGDEYGQNHAAGDSVASLRTRASSVAGRSTPDLVDDPGRFETAKQKKTTLLEGIRKFNFKPKRVRAFSAICIMSSLLTLCAGYPIPYRDWLHSKSRSCCYCSFPS